jgi:hypothetical protein
MRTLKRQLRTIKYANNNVDVTDEWGNTTKGYGEPVEFRLSVGYPTGSANNNGFGKSFDYDLELVTTDTSCPIDEYSHLWVDSDEEYDYIVRRKLPTLTHVRYGCERVSTRG